MDHISNMLSSIKNASMIGKTFVEVIHTKECEGIAKLMKDKGFAKNVKVFKPSDKAHNAYKMLHIELAEILDVQRVSKPGRRIYKKSSEIGRVVGGYGFAVVSTPRGLMTDSEARKRKLGGEVICKVN